MAGFCTDHHSSVLVRSGDSVKLCTQIAHDGAPALTHQRVRLPLLGTTLMAPLDIAGAKKNRLLAVFLFATSGKRKASIRGAKLERRTKVADQRGYRTTLPVQGV